MSPWRSGAALLALCLLGAAPAPWSPTPWLEDLAQMRAAMQEKYANLDWLTGERGLTLAMLFDPATKRIETAGSDEAARGVFDGLIRRIGDGHVAIDWPEPERADKTTSQPTDICQAMGFDARRSSPGIASHLAGYRPMATPISALPAGYDHGRWQAGRRAAHRGIRTARRSYSVS